MEGATVFSWVETRGVATHPRMPGQLHTIKARTLVVPRLKNPVYANRSRITGMFLPNLPLRICNKIVFVIPAGFYSLGIPIIHLF